MLRDFPPLYAILDAALVASREPELVAELAEAGVGMVQYRNKTAGAGQVLATCRRIRESLDSRRLRFLVNDRVDIATLAGAHGVHLGQEDLPVASARAVHKALQAVSSRAVRGQLRLSERLEREFWIGVSTHSLEQVHAADGSDADYIAFGPIFETATKARPEPTVGLDGLRQARKLTGKPLVAIGGITLDRAAEVYRAGADSLAVARDLLAASKPAARVRQYLEIALSTRS